MELCVIALSASQTYVVQTAKTLHLLKLFRTPLITVVYV